MAAGAGGRNKPKDTEPTSKKPAPSEKAATKEKSSKGK